MTLNDSSHDDSLFILAFGAHADDTDIGCSGTLALHAQRGYKVGVCDLTQAELSSNGTVVTRNQEAAMAAKALGLHMRMHLSMPDRHLVVSDSSVAEVVAVLRKYRPTFVFAPDFEDRHPDHRKCAEIVEEAVFSAALRRYGTQDGYPPHRVRQILYYSINGMSAPEIAVDISSTLEQKKEALRAYGSQFEQGAGAVSTPLNKGFLEAISGRDALVGHLVNIESAEGFRIRKPLLVQSLADLV